MIGKVQRAAAAKVDGNEQCDADQGGDGADLHPTRRAGIGLWIGQVLVLPRRLVVEGNRMYDIDRAIQDLFPGRLTMVSESSVRWT